MGMTLISKSNKACFSGNRESLPLQRFQVMRNLIKSPITNILDIGCWNREFLDLFPAKIEKYGIDIVEREFDSSIHFTKADISKEIPFPDSFFSVAVAGEVIEHLFDPLVFLKETWRVLESGGQLVLTTPNLCFWRNIIQILKKDAIFWVDYHPAQNGHIRYFAPRTMKIALSTSGFSEINIFSIEDVNGIEPFNVIGRIIQNVSRYHNMTLVAWCRKF